MTVLFEIGGMVGVGFGSVSPKIGVSVALGNKFGNRLVMVTIELAKPDTPIISEYVNRG
ncbi:MULTISPECIES: hypothetical protein [Microcoleus]|uniref:hypothetical protein n=1 Tax=Microcoleus TaxID=44471 RepID=UPI00168859BB|nr:hypothetical protein [Microcoleus sp. FACHB-84]